MILSLSLAALIIIFLAWSFFTPDHIRIEHSVVIALDKDDLFEELKSLENQSRLWGKKEEIEKVVIEGVDGQIGTEMIIVRNECKIRQKISKIFDGERLESELWISTFNGTNISYLQLEEINQDSTMLTWGVLGNHNFPSDVLSRISGANEDLEDLMAEGLQAMKNELSTS